MWAKLLLIKAALIKIAAAIFALQLSLAPASIIPKFGGAPAESTFAELDSNGVVKRVIVIDQATLNTGKWGDPKNWVQTYEDGSSRKNYAAPGYTYDKTTDAFIPPKPTTTATLNPTTDRWIVPPAVITPFVSSTSTIQ